MVECKLTFFVYPISKTYLDCIEASPTLNLVNDYFRFVIESFEVINTSASHIYHSALFLSPKTSIVRSLYEQYGRPLVRVVQVYQPHGNQPLQPPTPMARSPQLPGHHVAGSSRSPSFFPQR